MTNISEYLINIMLSTEELYCMENQMRSIFIVFVESARNQSMGTSAQCFLFDFNGEQKANLIFFLWKKIMEHVYSHYIT